LRVLARIFGAIFFVCVIAAALVYGHYSSALRQPVLEEGDSKTVVIPEGAGWSQTIEVLEREGLVEYPIYFDIWARWTELPRQVKAGTYRLEGPMVPTALGARLKEGGMSRDTELTVREGLTIFHIADKVDREGVVGRQAFLAAARSDELLAEAGIEAESFEGYLFPETYRFAEDATAEDVVRRMHRQWKKEWKEVVAGQAESMAELKNEYGFDRHDLVTLASIVQRETAIDDERRLIARVILNRLDESMRLQMDPTCVYGPDTYDDVPTPEVCKDPSNRYSTYVIDGLTPGPIANPGRSSLEAAVDPADGQDAGEYLYFVARRDGSGEHIFSKTYREHRRKVRKHLK
jgi:UPF0755 protein